MLPPNLRALLRDEEAYVVEAFLDTVDVLEAETIEDRSCVPVLFWEDVLVAFSRAFRREHGKPYSWELMP